MDGNIERLTENGYHGRVELIACFKDVFGKTYKSEPYPIDIDQWIEGKVDIVDPDSNN